MEKEGTFSEEKERKGEKKMKDFRRHAIEYVAMLMTESITSIDEQAQYLEKINEREGFTIDYISQGLPDGHWLRVEGVHLTAKEMAQAIALAKEWRP